MKHLGVFFKAKTILDSPAFGVEHLGTSFSINTIKPSMVTFLMGQPNRGLLWRWLQCHVTGAMLRGLRSELLLLHQVMKQIHPQIQTFKWEA